MRLAFVSLLALSSMTVVAVDCVNSATPIAQKCPTSAQSISFYANGSCPGSKPGVVVLSTMPGLCEIDVQNGAAVGLPPTGNFSGDASKTNYQLALGNWSLVGGSSDPQADPSSIQCTGTAAADGEVLVKCALNLCMSSGDDTGFQCTQGSCVEHLGPLLPDAGAIADAGVQPGVDSGLDGPTED